MKSVRSVSLGVVCGGVCCLTIFVLGIATVRVTVFVSSFVIFLESAAHFISSSTRSISLRIAFKASGTKTGTSQRKSRGSFSRTDATFLNHRYPLRSHEAL